jgi:hypothetical protein
MWCTLIGMQVDVRIALNQLWDNGGKHGQESKEGESKEEKDRQEEIGLRQHCEAYRKLIHIKARALCDSRGWFCRGLTRFSDLRRISAGSASAQALTDPVFFVEGAQPVSRERALSHEQ